MPAELQGGWRGFVAVCSDPLAVRTRPLRDLFSVPCKRRGHILARIRRSRILASGAVDGFTPFLNAPGDPAADGGMDSVGGLFQRRAGLG